MLCHALTGSLPLFLTGLNILKQVYLANIIIIAFIIIVIRIHIMSVNNISSCLSKRFYIISENFTIISLMFKMVMVLILMTTMIRRL